MFYAALAKSLTVKLNALQNIKLVIIYYNILGLGLLYIP